MRAMTGYELGERLARVLGLKELDYGDANQLINASEAIARTSDPNAIPIVSYLLGLADVSPSSYGQYVDMLVNQASAVEYTEERWTVSQFGEEAARLLSKSELTGSECDQILDNLQEALIHSEPIAVPLVTYLCGRGHCSPAEVGQKIHEAIQQ